MHVPVVDRDLRRRLRVPLAEAAVIDGVDDRRVRVHRLLLEVADEAVARAGGDHVHQKERVHEDSLGADHAQPEHRPRLLELDEGEEVHPLVLRLLEQSVDPPVVAVHAAKRPKVPQHPRRHPRDARDSLEEDGAVEHLVVCHLPEPVAGEGVEGPAGHLNEHQRQAVRHVRGLDVRLLHRVHLLLGPDSVGHGVGPQCFRLARLVRTLLHAQRVHVG
mmetsp:Transcript_20354/g.49185  ORF Transcript_20354/g.49185 Transcript_20354/m.49185 type:complete len:218 (-) Transcript_20354:300-953(-)